MDINGFLTQKYQYRTEFVEIPELKRFFGEQEKPGVEVRGLEGNEFARIQSGSREELRRAAHDILSSVGGADMVSAMKKLLGGGDAPEDIERRILYFEYALIWPEIKPDQRMQFASKLNRILPFDFLRVTNKIIELTGAGQCPEG